MFVGRSEYRGVIIKRERYKEYARKYIDKRETPPDDLVVLVVFFSRCRAPTNNTRWRSNGRRRRSGCAEECGGQEGVG